ncbi:MAG: hypothetical protein ACLFV3_03830 [Phycisphaeraceae bacterium]
MSEQASRVRVEQIDWQHLLPFLRLLEGFRLAIRPARLLLSLMLVLLLYLGGLGMDMIWGPQTPPGPAAPGAVVSTEAPYRVFETLLSSEVRAFESLIQSAIELNFGFSDFLAREGAQADGVLGSLTAMVLLIPAWVYQNHPAFLAVYLLYAFLLTALLGGAVTRLAALDASGAARQTSFQAVRFTARRYGWFVLAPVIPLTVAAGICLVLALAGLALFNLPVLDVLGAVLLGPLLAGGLVAALLLIGTVAGMSQLMPALAVEASDAFDAVSRVFNYVFGRPWRYLFYNGVMVVYGAICYLFVGLVVFLTLWLTKATVGLWSVGELAGTTRFDALLSDPRLDTLITSPEWQALDGSATLAAAIIVVWVKLLIAVLPAFAFSFFFCEQTWIYLLLRRFSEGTEFEHVHVEPGGKDEAAGSALPEKLEPSASERAEAETA